MTFWKFDPVKWVNSYSNGNHSVGGQQEEHGDCFLYPRGYANRQQNIPSSPAIPFYWINLLFETIAKMNAALKEVKWGYFFFVAFQTLYARTEGQMSFCWGSLGSLLISQITHNEWTKCLHAVVLVFLLLIEKHLIRWVTVVEAITCVLMIMTGSVQSNRTRTQSCQPWIEKGKKGGIRVQRKVFCVLKMKYEVLLTSIIHPATIGQVRFAGGNNVSFCDDFNIWGGEGCITF